MSDGGLDDWWARAESAQRRSRELIEEARRLREWRTTTARNGAEDDIDLDADHPDLVAER